MLGQMGNYDMKTRTIAAAALAALTVALPAKAVTLAWTLSGVTFDDGGTAIGTFTTDSTNGHLMTYSIDTIAGSTFGAFHYDPTTSLIFANNFFGSNSFTVSNTAFTRQINFAFVNPLTSGGVDPFATGWYRPSYECNNCVSMRVVTGGVATTATVPEPASWALLVAGFGLVGVIARRRTVRVAA